MRPSVRCGSRCDDSNERHWYEPCKPFCTLSASERQLRDAALLTRIQHDDVQALAMMVELYTPKLAAAVLGLLRSEESVKEVVQDVFIALWDQRRDITIRDTVAGYLYRAARNRAIDLLRSERSRQRLMDGLAAARKMSIAAESNAAERSLEDEEFLVAVRAAANELPALQRQVFLLHWEHDVAYGEIAIALGISGANVRQLMSRAVRRLAARFTAAPFE
jgi:RNA polymerase sigma-70 factor, ECF subfamily